MKKLLLLLMIIVQPKIVQCEQMILQTISSGNKNFDLNEIQKINFFNDNDNHTINIFLSNGPTEIYELSDLKKITFAPFGMLTKPLYIVSKNGNLDSFDLNSIKEIIYEAPTNAEEIENYSFKVESIYPMPSSNEIKISFYVRENIYLDLKIYNLMGMTIKNLISDDFFSGNHIISWDGTDNGMNKVSPGIYFIQLETEKIKLIKKIIIE